MQRHPSLRIDFVIADNRQDLINEAVDVALRFGLLHDSSMMARKLGTSASMLVASPAYLERAGTPRKPADVSDRKSVVSGQSVSVRLDLGGSRLIKKKNQK